MSSFKTFETRDLANQFVTKTLSGIIQSAVDTRGEAVILLSGGSTPKDAYALLAAHDLPWDKVRIGLVDDRRVSEDSPGSNQAMIRRFFSKGPAKAARLIDLITSVTDHRAGLSEAESHMTKLTATVDVCLMGMGTDGHTASWFPGSKGLEAALNIKGGSTVVAIDATGCPVAGEYTHRLSLTLPAIMRAKHVMLFITGDEKAKVFKNAPSKSVYEAPVKALLAAGPRLTTVWAP